MTETNNNQVIDEVTFLRYIDDREPNGQAEQHDRRHDAAGQ